MPQGSGKTAAIRALAERSGISLADTVAFGDDLNDIEMLKLCGTGVAVANAVPQALEAADEITLSNDEDGLAEWLIRLLRLYHWDHSAGGISCRRNEQNRP